MGLTIAVGLYAQNLADGEEQDFLDEPFDMLNLVLAEGGFAPHIEPKTIAGADYFEAQAMGYGGLHALRRLAAYTALENQLPPPLPYGEHDADPMLADFNDRHNRYLEKAQRPALIKMFKKGPAKPSYQHLIMHSDAEGFYVPRAFDDVIIDWTQPQRPGLGMMVGSSEKLLEECLEIARALKLPADFDPESEEFSDLLEQPLSSGEPWQVLTTEAYMAAQLIAACRASLRLNAVIQFC